jgi:hypothetical protein
MVHFIRKTFSSFLIQIEHWFWQNLIALDQLGNTLLFGMADETLSSRAFRAEAKGRFFGKVFRPMIDLIFFFDRNHCLNSFVSEVKRRHLPVSFQEI